MRDKPRESQVLQLEIHESLIVCLPLRLISRVPARGISKKVLLHLFSSVLLGAERGTRIMLTLSCQNHCQCEKYL